MLIDSQKCPFIHHSTEMHEQVVMQAVRRDNRKARLKMKGKHGLLICDICGECYSEAYGWHPYPAAHIDCYKIKDVEHICPECANLFAPIVEKTRAVANRTADNVIKRVLRMAKIRGSFYKVEDEN